MKSWPRRTVIAVAVVGMTLPTTANAAPSNSAPANSWPTAAGYNAAGSNLNPAENTLTSATLPSVEHKRTITLPPNGDCGRFPVETSPVVNGTTIYMTSGLELVASDLITGAELWRRTIDPKHITSWDYVSLVISGGRVYVAGLDCQSESDPLGVYWIFDAGNGKPIPHPVESGRAINSLVVSGSRMLLAGEGNDLSAYVTAFNTATRRQVWSQNSCYPDPLLVVGGAVIANCPRFSTPKFLRAFSLGDGHVIWSKPGNWRPQRGDSDAVGGTAVYAIDPAGRLTSLVPATGAVKWTSATESGPVLAVGKKRLYVTCDGTALCALDRANGARLWKQTNGGGAATTSVVVAADVVYPAPSTWPRLASTGANITGLGIPYWGRRPGDQIIIASGMIVVTNLGLRTIDIYGL